MCETSNYGSPSCEYPDHCADPDHFADTGYPDPVPLRQRVAVPAVPVPVSHTEQIKSFKSATIDNSLQHMHIFEQKKHVIKLKGKFL